VAVDPKWLESVRRKNREKFGMAGMAGLGAGAQDVASTLQSTRLRKQQQELALRQQSAEIAAKEALASDPRQAALLALPQIQVPEAPPIPKELVWAAGAVAVAFIGLIGLAVIRGGKS
jgi:hypothetical protein